MNCSDEDPNSPKDLYAIEYPGNVRNVDRMVETLGGIENIANAFSNNQRKLECRFRPEDRFCKSAVAERGKESAFLLKIKVKKIRSKDGSKEQIQFDTNVVGKVCKVFKFQNLMDFQYLPIERNAAGKYDSMYDKLVPKSIVPSSWLDEPCSAFLIPTVFSRTDTIQPYLSSKAINETSVTTIGRTRDRRSNYVKFISHEYKDVPKAPYAITLRYIQQKFINEEQILKIKELFNERPIWTKSALMCCTRYTNIQLKYLLALRAYHFTSGPFRIAWVRFGYDPRTDVSSRKFQIIDYRLRTNVTTILREQRPGRYLPGRTKVYKNSQELEDDGEQYEEHNYIFKPGFIPPQKQMFYQVCDIQLPEVQERLRMLTETPTYDPKTGWLTEEFHDFVREQIDKYIVAHLQIEDGSNSGSQNFLVLHKSVDESAEISSEDEDALSWDQDDFESENED